MSLCDIVDQLHDEHGLAHTGTAKESNLTTFHVGFKQIDHLNARSKHLLMSGKFIKLRSFPVNGVCALHVQLFHAVDRLADDIHHAPLNLFTSRHPYRTPRRCDFQITLQAVCIVHSHAAHSVFTDMLLHLNDEFTTVGALYFKSFINLWEHFLRIHALGIEIDVNNRTDNL